MLVSLSTFRDLFLNFRRLLIEDTSTHLLVDHPMSPADTSNALGTSVVERRKSPGLLNADKPGLAAVKRSITNYGIVHPSFEGKLIALVATQVSYVHKSCSGFRSL